MSQFQALQAELAKALRLDGGLPITSGELYESKDSEARPTPRSVSSGPVRDKTHAVPAALPPSIASVTPSMDSTDALAFRSVLCLVLLLPECTDTAVTASVHSAIRACATRVLARNDIYHVSVLLGSPSLSRSTGIVVHAGEEALSSLQCCEDVDDTHPVTVLDSALTALRTHPALPNDHLECILVTPSLAESALDGIMSRITTTTRYDHTSVHAVTLSSHSGANTHVNMGPHVTLHTCADYGDIPGTLQRIAKQIASSKQAFIRALLDARPPILISSTGDVTVRAGQLVTLETQALSTTPLSYQWFHRDVAIAGATSPTLVLSRVERSHCGTYHCTLSNSAGAVQTLPIRTSVLTPVKSHTTLTTPQSSIVVQRRGSHSSASSTSGLATLKFVTPAPNTRQRQSPTASPTSLNTSSGGGKPTWNHVTKRGRSVASHEVFGDRHLHRAGTVGTHVSATGQRSKSVEPIFERETLALNVADFQLSLRSPGTFAPHTLPKKALMKPDSPPHGISYRRSEYYSASPPKAAAPAATAQTQAPQASTSDVMIDVDATAPVAHSETAVKTRADTESIAHAWATPPSQARSEQLLMKRLGQKDVTIQQQDDELQQLRKNVAEQQAVIQQLQEQVSHLMQQLSGTK